jgi:hypothetical protein
MRLLIAFAVLTVVATPASATTCTQAVAKCKQEGSSKPNIDRMCEAAGASCMGWIFHRAGNPQALEKSAKGVTRPVIPSRN